MAVVVETAEKSVKGESAEKQELANNLWARTLYQTPC